MQNIQYNIPNPHVSSLKENLEDSNTISDHNAHNKGACVKSITTEKFSILLLIVTDIFIFTACYFSVKIIVKNYISKNTNFKSEVCTVPLTSGPLNSSKNLKNLKWGHSTSTNKIGANFYSQKQKILEHGEHEKDVEILKMKHFLKLSAYSLQK